MSIFATKWNEMIRRLARNRILGYNVQTRVVFRHPWNCRFSWLPDPGQWGVQVHPGAVNCVEAEATGLIAGEHRQAPLGEQPVIPLSDFIEPLNVPEFFQKKGVQPSSADAVSIDADAETFTVSLDGLVDSAVPAAERRQLRHVDLVLQIPRPAGKITIEPDDRGIPILNTTFVDAQGPPLVYSTRRYSAPAALTLPEIFLAGGDVPYDRLHLARCWFLSPPGTAPGKAVDASWQPYAEQKSDLFWNLNHAVRLPPVELLSDPIDASPLLGLAGGAGDRLIQGAVDALNENAALAEILLARVQVESRVWSV